MADINALVDQLSELTVLEAADLAKALEEKYYARGVGNILSVDKATGEREELVSVKR